MSYRLQLVVLVVASYLGSQFVYASQLAPEQPATGFTAALSMALQSNPTVRGRRAEADAARHGIREAKAARLPNFSIVADNVNEQINNQGTLRAQQPIYTFGKISARIRQAEAIADVEELKHQQSQRELIERTALAYAAVQAARKRLDIAAQSVQSQRKLHERIKRRNAGQLASQADVSFADSRVVQTESTQRRIEGELHVAQTELLALTQGFVDSSPSIDQQFLQLPSELVLQEFASAGHINVVVMQAEVSATRRRVESERRASLPTLYARAEHDFQEQRQLADRTRFGVAFEASVDGFGLGGRSRVSAATARLAAATEELGATRLEVQRQINVLIAERNTQRSLERAQSTAVEAIDATLASFLRQYESGRKSWFEVLNLQRESTEQALLLANISHDGLRATLRLAALAGLLDNAAGLSAANTTDLP